MTPQNLPLTVATLRSVLGFALRLLAFFCLTISSVSLLGCGGSSPAASTPPLEIAALAGDWRTAGQPPASDPLTTPSPVAGFTGTLEGSGSAVTGTLVAYSYTPSANTISCINFAPLSVSGSLDNSGKLSLTFPIAGGTGTINSVLGSNRQTGTAGTYTIVGGACAMPATPMLINNFANLTGTYSGTLNQYATSAAGITYPVAGTATSMSVTLTESTTPDALGHFALSGSGTTAGACPTAFTLSPGNIITGGGLGIDPSQATSGSVPAQFLYGVAQPDASAVYVGLFYNCPPWQLQGNLTRQ